MHRLLMSVLLCLALSTSPWAVADPAVRTVDPSSAEGRALIEPMVADLVGQLGKPASLAVERLVTAGDWAFIRGKIIGADGTLIDYAGTPFAEDAAHGMKSKSYVGLLRNADQRWTRVTSRVGPTDVVEQGWTAQYGAPAALFAPG